MYGILNDGTLIIAPKKVEYGDNVIYNPPDEIYLELGYYPIIFTEKPQDAPTGYHYEPYWEQDESEIIQKWHLVEDSDRIDETEAFNILIGGAL